MMQTLRDIVEKGKAFLESRKVLHPKRCIEDFLALYFGCSRCDLYMQLEKPLEEGELVEIRAGVKRLAEHEPLEYVVARQKFYGLDLTVTSKALVPRPETEIFVDKIAQEIRGTLSSKTALWDIGTGTGAIGLALKKALPSLCVTISDLSQEALALAQSNAKKHALAVRCLQGDLFSAFPKGEKVDILVSNPPYLSQEEYAGAHPTLLFEPKMALLGGQTGLEFYERFEKESKPFLKKTSKIFFEIGSQQGEALCKIFSGSFWKNPRVFLDWARLPRFFFLEIE